MFMHIACMCAYNTLYVRILYYRFHGRHPDLSTKNKLTLKLTII